MQNTTYLSLKHVWYMYIHIYLYDSHCCAAFLNKNKKLELISLMTNIFILRMYWRY